MRVDLGGGRGWLEDPAARSIARIDREIGHRCQITEAGRTEEKQLEHWNNYQRNGYPIALSPYPPPRGNGPSVHQLGAAIDSNEAQRFVALMERHGWRRTVYRNGVLVEPWHFEYFWSLDQHRNETITLAQVGGVWTFQEEDDMGTLDNTEQNYQTFASWLQRAFKFDVRPGGKGANWQLGPTVFELLSAADDSGDIKAIAVKMTDEDRQAIAAEVAKSIVVPSGASKADVAAAIDAGLAKLVLKPAS
jgi:hypothetical protein